MRKIDFKGPEAKRDYFISHNYVRGVKVEKIAQYLIDNHYWEGKVESVIRLCHYTLYKYRALLKIDKEYERVKDVLRLESDIDTRPYGKKDKVDLMRAKHDILNGDGNSKNGISSVVAVTIKIEGADGDKIQPSQSQSVASFQR